MEWQQKIRDFLDAAENPHKEKQDVQEMILYVSFYH